MTGYEVYTFLVCLLVFLLIGGILTLLLIIIFRYSKKIISLGGEDDIIVKEKEEAKKKKRSKVGSFIDYTVSGLIAAGALSVFIFALLSVPGSISTPITAGQTAQVVKSSSMSYKNEENKYLFENDLNDQFDTFDLVFIEALPEEKDLKLYDIVVYESNGRLIIHRIVEIEEPNQYHPDVRYFKTQGDAIDAHDKFPVLYSQMRGIYRGERVQFIGSFILFLQSYPGFICIGLIVAASVVIPLLDSHLETHKDNRYQYLIENNLIPTKDEDSEEETEETDETE